MYLDLLCFAFTHIHTAPLTIGAFANIDEKLFNLITIDHSTPSVLGHTPSLRWTILFGIFDMLNPFATPIGDGSMSTVM